MLTRAETDDKLVYAVRLRSCISLLKMYFSAKHDLDSDSDIEMNIQPCQFEPQRGKCGVTPNTIRTVALTRIESPPYCFPVNTLINKALYLGS